MSPQADSSTRSEPATTAQRTPKCLVRIVTLPSFKVEAMSPRYFFVPNADGASDERSHFTRTDFVTAFLLVCPREEAERWADELLAPQSAPDQLAGYDTHLSDDVLDLLSLASEDCARRVQHILRLSDADAEARRARVRRRLARHTKARDERP
jgi:hypothetical protein